MAWDESKDLLQIQVDPEFKEKLQKLADLDQRSLVKECLWLIEQGLKRRAAMEAVEDIPPVYPPGKGGRAPSSFVRPRRKASGQ
ncbi:MAG: hypothetical protein IMZ50_11010 [Candidatus Atribacteria bacterium]|nr:hypothetical protein [Candidatus Atribacteria bacterium]